MGFFLVRNSRICQRCLLGLGGCARPWLQGQASSPWIPGSLSCPNCCPEKLYGNTGTRAGAALPAGNRDGEGRGTGRELQLHTTSPIAFGNSSCDIQQFTESREGQPWEGPADMIQSSLEQGTCPGGVGMSPDPALGSGKVLPHAQVGLAEFIDVQILPGWVVTPQLCHPLCHSGPCPQPCCCGTGSAWPRGHGAPVSPPCPSSRGTSGNKHPEPCPEPCPRLIPRVGFISLVLHSLFLHSLSELCAQFWTEAFLIASGN